MRQSDENPKASPIQGPMTKSRTKQSEDILQQMVSAILDKAQVEKDKGPDALTRILIVVEGPNIRRSMSNIFLFFCNFN